MRFLSRSCLLLLAAGLCASASATNVYQWRDAKGVVHSSDKPPPGQKYETRRIDNRGQTVETAPAAAAKPDPQCATAQKNLTLLAGAAPVRQDTDGDGKADLTLQLGPVIKGSSLRDVAPFYKFGDFRDQIEFAKLARALNDRASAGLQVPEGELVGKTVSFSGTVDLKAATDPWLVTAVTLSVAP